MFHVFLHICFCSYPYTYWHIHSYSNSNSHYVSEPSPLFISLLPLISSFSSLVFVPIFHFSFHFFLSYFSILSTEKWGPSVPILTRIIDSEGSDKVLGDCVVFGTLFKEMHLRSSVSVRDECSLKNVFWYEMFENNVLLELWCFTFHLLFFFSTFHFFPLMCHSYSYSCSPHSLLIQLHAINDKIVLHRAYSNLSTHIPL